MINGCNALGSEPLLTYLLHGNEKYFEVTNKIAFSVVSKV